MSAGPPPGQGPGAAVQAGAVQSEEEVIRKEEEERKKMLAERPIDKLLEEVTESAEDVQRKLRERETFSAMEKLSLDYQCELKDQIDGEHREQAQMLTEEKYRNKLLTAEAKFYYKSFKEAHLMEVEYWRRKAALTMEVLQCKQRAHAEHLVKLEEHSEQLDLAAYRRILPAISATYQKHGMAKVYPEEEKLRRPTDTDPSLSNNYLRPLPPRPAMESIHKFKKYLYKGGKDQPGYRHTALTRSLHLTLDPGKKGPVKDLSEGFELQQHREEHSPHALPHARAPNPHPHTNKRKRLRRRWFTSSLCRTSSRMHRRSTRASGSSSLWTQTRLTLRSKSSFCTSSRALSTSTQTSL